MLDQRVSLWGPKNTERLVVTFRKVLKEIASEFAKSDNPRNPQLKVTQPLGNWWRPGCSRAAKVATSWVKRDGDTVYGSVVILG